MASSTSDASASTSTSTSDEVDYNSTITQLEGRISNLTSLHPNLIVQPPSLHRLALHTVIRNVDTPRTDFVFYADQLLRLLIEFALSTLPTRPKQIQTPTGHSFIGKELASELCGVSILRAGESMEQALRQVIRSVKIGKILIQRDESVASKPAKLFYSKFPSNIASCQVLLMDPMLATGNSVLLALSQLLSLGIPMSSITFITLICAPEGIEAVYKVYPDLRIVSGWVDEKLNQNKFVVPGVGDFGDRYFGT